MRWPLVLSSSFALVAALAAPARATPNFPPAIQQHLGLSAPPPCAICHQDGKTGTGTVTTPFGVSMRSHGLVPNDTSTLTKALDALEAEKVDSDGDGTPDIEELQAGSDPNTAGGGSINGPPVAYGCGASARIAPEGPLDAVAAFGSALAVLGLVLARRRTR